MDNQYHSLHIAYEVIVVAVVSSKTGSRTTWIDYNKANQIE